MKKLRLISFLVTAFAVLASLARGGDFEDGLAAAAAGDYNRAYQLWLLEADKGNASAQSNIGVLYSRGHGVPQDDAEAAKWFLLAAQQGEPVAQVNLGVMYAKGQGVPRDDKNAAKLFLQAARQGDSKAQFSLGVMYDVGRGVAQNQVVACAWYILASENGEDASVNYLSAALQNMSPGETEMARQLAEQFRTEIGR